MSKFLDMAAQFANLDPGYIMEQLVKVITGSITEAPQIIKDMTFYLNFKDGVDFDNMDYYYAGAAAGRLIKVLTSFTLAV